MYLAGTSRLLMFTRHRSGWTRDLCSVVPALHQVPSYLLETDVLGDRQAVSLFVIEVTVSMGEDGEHPAPFAHLSFSNRARTIFHCYSYAFPSALVKSVLPLYYSLLLQILRGVNTTESFCTPFYLRLRYHTGLLCGR